MCTPIEDEGPDIPLIVGLSVGLGGAALLVVVGIIIYLVCRSKTTKVDMTESGSVDG